MNIKSLLLTAVAASMTLVACNSGDGPDIPDQDKMTKSVTITLPNISQTPGSRATGKGMAEGQIALKNFKVFFLDASGNCVNDEVPTTATLSGKESDLTQPALYFDGDNVASNVGTNSKITYHFLPASVSKVVVVGNIGDEEYSEVNNEYNIANDGDSGTDVELDSDSHPYYPLYGEAPLTPKGSADDKNHNNVYTASVNLKPRVARLEIYGFEYTANDKNSYTYQSIQPIKIALANYATAYNLSTGDESSTAKSKRSAHMVPTDASKVWDWAANATSPWANSFTDKTLGQGDKKYADFNTDVANDDTDGSKYTDESGKMKEMITFSIADSKDGKNNNPELLLTFYGVDNSNTKTPLYLHGKFAGTSHEAFEAGKIYRVLFPIKDGSWNSPDRCVELTVTVAEWSIVAVTPEFN